MPSTASSPSQLSWRSLISLPIQPRCIFHASAGSNHSKADPMNAPMSLYSLPFKSTMSNISSMKRRRHHMPSVWSSAAMCGTETTLFLGLDVQVLLPLSMEVLVFKTPWTSILDLTLPVPLPGVTLPLYCFVWDPTCSLKVVEMSSWHEAAPGAAGKLRHSPQSSLCPGLTLSNCTTYHRCLQMGQTLAILGSIKQVLCQASLDQWRNASPTGIVSSYEIAILDRIFQMTIYGSARIRTDWWFS